jgi:nucleotide-binding universal stress UspA family protein
LKALEHARGLAEKASNAVLEIFPSWTVRPEACADTPAWGLVLKAAEWKPDLIVVGSQGRSAIGRLVLGSVSQKVVTHADCSVRVARGRVEEGASPDSPIRLVVGVDGSQYSEATVEAITKRVWPAGTEARVVTALDLMMMTALNWIDNLSDEDEAEVTAFVEAAAEKLRAAGLVVSTVIKNGDPKRVLVDEAEAWEADSIFVGAQGLRAIERLLIGSVSAAVAAHAHCSVEVVRAAPTA